MKRLLTLSFSAILITSGAVQAMPYALQDVIADLEAECAATDDGRLSLNPGAVQPLEYDKFAIPVQPHDFWVLDETHVICSSDGSFRCGTGGCPVHFIRAETVTTELAWSWRLTQMAETTVILLELHPGRCTRRGHCFKAMTLDELEGYEVSVEPPQ